MTKNKKSPLEGLEQLNGWQSASIPSRGQRLWGLDWEVCSGPVAHQLTGNLLIF